MSRTQCISFFITAGVSESGICWNGPGSWKHVVWEEKDKTIGDEGLGDEEPLVSRLLSTHGSWHQFNGNTAWL